ncbi:MAG: GDSL-type esterase/lipase family protein [Eubacteriales bacterium]|jgi:lysophospholipase L1-like esterase
MEQWIRSWGYLETNFHEFPIEVQNATQRIFCYNNLRGGKVRLHFSNLYGKSDLQLAGVTLSTALEGERVCTDSMRQVTVEGKGEIVIPAGEELYSDPVEYPVQPGQWLAVSVYVDKPQTIWGSACCMERCTTRVINRFDGNELWSDGFVGQEQSQWYAFFRYKTGFQCFYAVNGVEVWTGENPKVVVAFGDSLTHHGFWSQALARKLYEKLPGGISVINAGICGNRILHDGSIRSVFGQHYGICGKERLERDVFSRGKVDMVLMLMGINDILHPTAGIAPAWEKVTFSQLWEGLNTCGTLIHNHGATALVSTLLPYWNFQNLWKEEDDALRRQVNETLRNQPSGVFDGLVDLEQVVRDPALPRALREEYDCGDHLHLNQAGGEAIARSIAPQVEERLL